MWEYKVLNVGYTMLEQELNTLGQQGWEVVTMSTYGNYFTVILKRPKP